MGMEVEAKIRVRSLAPYRDKLKDMGAAHEGACLERNWVLDRPDDALMREGSLLRVRNVGGVGGILTVKRRIDGGLYKTREEIESMVDSTEDLLRQLELIGFQIKWIYEKFRSTWLWRDCVLALDECPEIGSFIEIEGQPERIGETARLLGLDPDSHLDENYLTLWRRHLQERGEKPRHMTFSPEEAARLNRLATANAQLP